MKILLSWFDPRHDFEAGTTKLSRKGINCEVHQHWFADHGYAKHLLLLWKEDPKSKQIQLAVQAMAKEYDGHGIEARVLSFADPLSLPDVHRRVQELLLELRGHELDLFINPGYQMMQLSWLLCHQSLQLKTRLLQVRQAKFTDSKRPEVSEVEVKVSEEAYALLLHAHPIGKEDDPNEPLLTPTLQIVYERAKVAAAQSFPVFITGESGTGKELLAKYLHKQSGREHFRPVNCAGLNDNLLQSTLFGHAKGAFTDAHRHKAGFFEEVGPGTLFLDEIGDISPLLQQTLLRVLQDKSFQRLGENETRYTEARIVVATNHTVASLSSGKYFRSDLLYRLHTLDLNLPPWRKLPFGERDTLLDKLNLRMAKAMEADPLVLKTDARLYLLESEMPGNFRLLDIIFKRLYTFCRHKREISLGVLLEEMASLFPEKTDGSEVAGIDMTIDEVQRWQAARVYVQQGRHLANTAASLGISTNTLKKLLGK